MKFEFPMMTRTINRVFGKSGKYLGQKSESKALKYSKYVEARNKLSQPDFTIFIEDQQIDHIYVGMADVSDPDTKDEYKGYDPKLNPTKHIMHHILQPRNKIYTQWAHFDGRQAKRLEYEQHLCIYQGREQFRLVSPIHRKNIYVNVFDGYHNNSTPVDFFNVDYKKYPLVYQFNFIEVTLNGGDCIYIPAYYYVQSKTLGTGLHSETIMISEQYESHSKFIDLFMEALENE